MKIYPVTLGISLAYTRVPIQSLLISGFHETWTPPAIVRFVGSGLLPVPHLYRDAANSLTYDFYVAKNNRSTGGSFQAKFNDYKRGIDPVTAILNRVTGWRTPIKWSWP